MSALSRGQIDTELMCMHAAEGRTGNGEETIFRFAGCPTFKAVPQPETGKWKPPSTRKWATDPRWFILMNGKWIDMGEHPWNSPDYEVSRLPGWHPLHSCGIFCDGQDGNGKCRDQKNAGPPNKTPLQELTEGVWAEENEWSSKWLENEKSE